MRTVIWRSILVSILALGCSGGDAGPPDDTDVTGVLRPAAGLAAADFDLYAPGDDVEKAVATGGGFTASVSATRAGFLFAGPRAGSPSASRVAAGTGLYMTPAMGDRRVVGPPYRLATSGATAMDATTTVISMVLLHPMLAHAAPDVTTQQAGWMLDRLAAGWPRLAEAARLYDEDLAGGRDFGEDAAFAAALRQVVEDVASGLPDARPATKPRPAVPATPKTPAQLSKTGNEVSTLVVQSDGDSGVKLTAGTVTGTGLDYYFAVRPLPAADFPGHTSAAAFTNPAMLTAREAQPVIAVGFVPGSSYFSYLDVIGNTMKLVTRLVTLPVQPSGTIDLPASKAIYEVRFFSGGFGSANNPDHVTFAGAHYRPEIHAAFIHNLVAGFFEVLGLIPGAEGLLGDDVGAAVAQDAVLQLVQEMEALLTAKGTAGVEMEDIYGLLFNSAKAAVDKYIEKETEGLQGKGWKKFVKWAGWGGKKAVKMIMSVPGKVAKGGAASNRAVRLVAPYSIMELWLVGVGEEAGGTSVSASYEWSWDELGWEYLKIAGGCDWTITGQGIVEDFRLLDRDGFSYAAILPTGKACHVSIACHADFLGTEFRENLTDGSYYVHRPKTLERIVPVLNMTYGAYMLLTKEGGFNLGVTGTGAGYELDFTFDGAGQEVWTGPAYRVFYTSERYDRHGVKQDTKELERLLQMGALQVQSR